jgi:hypothetical protein
VNERQEIIVIDYVNDVCDMRLKSRHYDGVPDALVQRIAEQIIVCARKKTTNGHRPALPNN